MTTNTQRPTDNPKQAELLPNPDSIEKIWDAFKKIWTRAVDLGSPILMSIPADEARRTFR